MLLPRNYDEGIDPESALKFAVRRVRGQRAELIEGVVKRKWYAEYGAPLYLLVDRLDKTVTLFSEPGRLGYANVDGPHAFGTPVRLPEPFGIELDTSGL